MRNVLFFVQTCRFQIAVANFEVNLKMMNRRQQNFGIVQQEFNNM